MSALTDWELWAVANYVLQRYGDQAPSVVSKKIRALVLAGDLDDAAVWERIERRLLALIGPGRGGAA